MSKSRLLYLVRLVIHGSHQHIRMILLQWHDPHSWLRLACDTLHYIWLRMADKRGLQDPLITPVMWLNAIREEPKKWRSLFLRAEVSAVADGIDSFGACPAASVNCASHDCHLCSSSYPTLIQLRSHLASKHSYRNPLRMRVYSTSCQCCHVEFHRRSSMVKHLTTRQSRCSLFYLNSVPPLSIEAVLKLDDGAARIARTADPKAIKWRAVRPHWPGVRA